jgi:hypothetical protein
LVHGLVHRVGWSVNGSTVDSIVADGRGLLELGLMAACHGVAMRRGRCGTTGASLTGAWTAARR